jgi:hypothetical protein
MAGLDWRPGAVNVLTMFAPGSQSMDLELHSELVPMPYTELLPGPCGLLRMDGFAASTAETAAFRSVLEDFERAGVRSWIVDMRWNSGGRQFS